MRFIILAALALGLTSCRISANFHEIEAGVAYRSAQLTKEELTEAVTKLGVKTVINLRGAHPGAAWYEDELAVTQQYGVQLVNIGMDAAKLPHRANLIEFLDTLKNAPRPILIHCKAGADRTGEESAIYQMIYMGKSRGEAKKMLALKYHHVKAIFPAKDYFIESVWQGEDWARNEYDPCSGKYKYYDVNNPVCHGVDPGTIIVPDDNEPEPAD
jgi:protein tyrosine phosphatase (PTP) superfamily phosphohydrolase (DUF442 family)